MKKINLLKILLASFCLIFAIATAQTALAANLNNAFKVNDEKNDDNLDKAASVAGFNTKANTAPEVEIFQKLISVALSFLGVIFLVLMIYGGYLWMSDQGNEEQAEKAKKTIQAAIIGLIIVISSYAISIFVFSYLAKSTLREVKTPETTQE